MLNERKLAETVLDYWYTLEFLGQDPFPALSREEQKKIQGLKLKKRNDRFANMLFELKSEEDIFPQIRQMAHECGMNLCGNITFYVGKIKRELCIKHIARLMEVDDDRPEKNEDNIAWMSLQLSAEGTYIEKSFSLSPIVWAIKQIAQAKDDSAPIANSLSNTCYETSVKKFEKYLVDLNNRDVQSEKPDEQSEESDFKPEVNALKLSHIIKLADDIYQEYLKYLETSCMDGKNQTAQISRSVYVQLQLFKDEKARKTFESEEYLGLRKDFFSEDLMMVLNYLKANPAKFDKGMLKALQEYIVCMNKKDAPHSDRFNLVPGGNGEKSEALRLMLLKLLNVKNAPFGKWPSRYMPALMQQIAVNVVASQTMLDDKVTPLVDTPVFSVNGPPGTGKTTMLKEIIVHNIVERAKLLAAYKKPDDAFEKCFFQHGQEKNHSYSQFWSMYYKLKDDRINNYSILVTSCNNAAVENISRDLPISKDLLESLGTNSDDNEEMQELLQEVQGLFDADKGEIERYWDKFNAGEKGAAPDLYFSKYATALLKNEAWGAVSAAMGKRSNIKPFCEKVLQPICDELLIGGRSQEIKAEQEARYIRVRDEFQKQLAVVEQMREESVKLSEEGLQFQEELKALHEKKALTQQKLKAFAASISEACHSIVNVENMKDVLEKEYCVLIEQEEEWQKNKNMADSNLKHIEQEISFKRAEQEYLKESRTSGMFGFFKSDQKAEIDRKISLIQNDIDNLYSKHEEYRLQCEKACKEIRENERNKRILKQCYAEVDGNFRLIKEIEKKYQDIIAEHKKFMIKLRNQSETLKMVPLDDRFMDDLQSADESLSTSAQVSNPWFTAAYNRQREKLFYWAIRMHKAFILNSKSCHWNYRNLLMLWRIDGQAVFHPEDREACMPALLQSLWLLVPVMSTTFASVGRFLKDIVVPGVIGTLVVDEAGQAPPQMAVGALFRARQAIIVGDPKQVEPVVTDELSLLKEAFEEDYYLPYKNKSVSVQQFADQINPFGTYLAQEGDTDFLEWVGSPLLVHRRCISPMYDISNQISYNGIMKQQTLPPSQKKVDKFCLSKSLWIDVQGAEEGNKNHFVRAQAEKVLELLKTAFEKDDVPNLYIISPFITVVRGITNYLKNYSGTDINTDKLKAWVEKKNIGTVHTFQGKEANEVVFLLGCDNSAGASGAIKWVNSNIVNVAATRAKYRLYVIGERAAWEKSKVVSQMMHILDEFSAEKN